ncbi:MgtC/SapB family protein [Amphibacillus marinus]|nr:MgtC/SapB family protein [Amphibacillus marinus]
MAMRIFLAFILSGVIGFEREMNKHSAGFRTHILVGVSSCLMMMMSLYGFQEYVEAYPDYVRFDPARIPSYVISGIGFLGAGTIIVNGMTVRGLTTAASIWAVAGLGLVIGIGMYEMAILTTLIILLSLILLNNFNRFIIRAQTLVKLEVKLNDITGIENIFSKFNQFNIVVKHVDIQTVAEMEAKLTTEVEFGKGTKMNDVFYQLLKLDEVVQVKEL